jgi:hypothetical protein
VCIVYRPTTILLVLVEDKTFFNKTSTEAQMVAEAIAAFQYNNTKRVARGQPALEVMTIPCITMVGTNPTFYLVTVTEELSDAVKRRVSDGMADFGSLLSEFCQLMYEYRIKNMANV